MEAKALICDQLRLAPQHVRWLGIPGHCAVCLVSYDWLKNVSLETIGGGIPENSQTLPSDLCDEYLAASCNSIPAEWFRLVVRIVAKSDHLVDDVLAAPLYCNVKDYCLSDLLAHICQENRKNLYLNACSKLLSQQKTVPSRVKKKFSDLFREVVLHFQPHHYIRLDGSQPPLCESSVSSSSEDSSKQLSPNIVSTYLFLELQNHFLLLQPYYPYSLWDVVSYSPALFNESHAKTLFVLYQILQAMQLGHSIGLSAGHLKLHKVFVDKKLWIDISFSHVSFLLNQLSGPPELSGIKYMIGAPSALSLPNRDKKALVEDARAFISSGFYTVYSIDDLSRVVSDWVHSRISNFKYLMILNYLAGRRLGDPNNHPILPWVSDFTSEHKNFRDLSKTKYRLNKGDRQLDLTYEELPVLSGDPVHRSLYIPHHVSDVLSDITYYVYKARQTSKSILCAHVRPYWVPSEYPLSIQRIQQWTPDECIPEFFLDPAIFKSMHNDLPDLGIPDWCTSPQDFIEKHMALLESPRVSHALHNWIDLTFGHKLSGTASVESKNVHLQLVDNHTHVTNCGVVQLFSHPHPQRILPPRKRTSSFGSVLIDGERDGMDESFHHVSIDSNKSDYAWFMDTVIPFYMDDKPLSKLEQLESLYAFCPKSVCDSGKETVAQEIGAASLSAKDLVAHDMQAFACLMCEMFLAPKTRLLGPNATLKERYQLIHKLCQMDLNAIPRPLHQAASILLQLNDNVTPLLSERGPVFNYIPINSLGLPPLTPSLMTHPMIDVIPFPSYFSQLYHCLCQVKQKDYEIECLNFSNAKTPCEKAKMTKVLAREKVSILQTFLQKYEIVLGQEGVDLLLPYVEELLQVKDTAVQCAWILFDIMSRQLGPDVAKNKFLPQITKLYTEDYSTPKHLKLYHHKFLVQLLVRFQLQTFLENFSTLLVEAVAGYKDFVIETDTELPEVVEFRRQKSDFSRKVRNPIPACPEEVSEDGYQGNGQDGNENHAEEGKEGGGSHDTDEDAEEFAAGNFILEDIGSSVDKGDSEKGSDSVSADQDSLKSEESGYKRSLLGIDDADSVFQSGRRFSFPVSIHDRNASRERSDSGSHPRSISNTSDRDNLSISAENADADLENMASSEKSSQSEGDDLEDRDGDDNGNIDDEDEDEPEEEDEEEESDKTEIYEDCHTLMSQIEGSPGHGTQTGRTDPGMPITGSVQQGPHMVRSETDEFTRCLAGTSWDEIVNIRDMATESVKWLCHRLGPLLAARYLSLNLIRLLPLCYLDEEQLLPVLENAGNCRKSCRLVGGDTYAVKVLECLSFMAILYGEQVILLQYFPAMEDMVALAEKEMTQTSEAGLVASLVLMRHMIPLLSEKTFMDLLQDTKVHNILHSVIRLTTSNMRFPSGHLARSLICHKIIDVIYIIGVRIGFEMTRKHLTSTMQLFFDSFFQVHCPDACPSSAIEESFNKSNELSTHSSPHLSRVKTKEKQSGSSESEESEELYWNLKKDGRIQDYKIGSSVNVHDLRQSSPPQTFHRLKSRVKQRTNTTGVAASASVPAKLKFSESQLEQQSGSPGSDDQLDLVMEEMKKVFNPELAHTAYIPLCQIFGSIHMEQSLWNDDLIRQLCSQHDTTLDKLPSSGLGQSFDSSLGASTPDLETPDDTKSIESSLDGKESDANIGGIGSNVAVVGNRIQLQHQLGSGHPDMPHIHRAYRHTGILNIGQDDLKSTEMESNNQRHLRGNWLAYWEHELGLSDRASMFNFKHIKLQTFLGHNTSIRSLCVLDSENSFISASKDKTVKLWSLTSFGDGSGKCGCQWTYRLHKKSVFSVGFLESVRLVASCDSTVHIWDPFRGECVRQLESSKNSPVIALAPIPAPSCMMITATNDSTLRFLDLRKAEYAHEYRCSPLSAGLIRSVTVSPDSNWVAVAFSSGIVSVLDIRTGTLLGQRKGHDGDILQIKACNRHTFVTSSFDQSMRLWNASDLKEICQFKGASEPVHCIGLYRNQIISATAGNKIGVHSSIDRHATYTSTKLHPEIFKGVLASMAVLPLNRTLLLGADNGAIRLLC